MNKKILENRICLLEFIISFIFIEERFNLLNNKHYNGVLCYLHNFKYSEYFLKSLLYVSIDYEENGIIPYSAYFYKEYL